MESVAQRDDLVRQEDAVIFAVAQRERRAVVTENIDDFRALGDLALSRGEPHAGLIFVTNRSFPRPSHANIGDMVRALDQLLAANQPIAGRELWLRPVSR